MKTDNIEVHGTMYKTDQCIGPRLKVRDHFRSDT